MVAFFLLVLSNFRLTEEVANMKLVVCILATLVTVTWAVEEVPHHGSHHPVREPHEVNGEHNPEFDHEAVIGKDKP